MVKHMINMTNNKMYNVGYIDGVVGCYENKAFRVNNKHYNRGFAKGKVDWVFHNKKTSRFWLLKAVDNYNKSLLKGEE